MNLEINFDTWNKFGLTSINIDTETGKFIDDFDINNISEKEILNFNLDSTSKYLTQAKISLIKYPFTMNIHSFDFKSSTFKNFKIFLFETQDKVSNIYNTSLTQQNFIPELVMIAMDNNISIHRVYTIHEASNNYRGKFFSNDRLFWLKREPEEYIKVNEFTIDLFEELNSMFKVEIALNDPKLLLLGYNFVSSNFRELSERNVLVPPIEV